MSLTDHIADDLRRRLAAAGQPIDLRLAALAQAYQVSTQPVRLALARLRREGLLESPGRPPARTARSDTTASPSARIKKSPRPLPPGDPTKRDLHARLSAFAVRLSLRGEETFLREESTAGHFGVSRAIARDALQRLHAEGVVEHVPRRGWRVRPFSRQDMADFLQVREVLEVRALTLAWPRLDRADLETFYRRNDPRAAKPDNRLHDYWIERSENRYLRRFFAQHAPFFSALFKWEDHDPAAARQSCEQHRIILRAILDNDRPTAVAALIAHIHGNHPVLSSWPDQPASS